MRWAGGGCSGRATNVQPPEAALSRGLEVHPAGEGSELELWIDPRYVDAGYGWSFPARDEVRIGVGSFDPHDPVKQPTLRLVEDVARVAAMATRATGSRTGCGPAAEDGVFFAGDSAGHCLPLTAEGIRTAFYFGIALGRELRAVLEGRQDTATRLDALRRVLGLAPVEVRGDVRRPAVDPAPARAPAGLAHARVRAPARV